MGHYDGEPGLPAWADSVDASIASLQSTKAARDAIHVDVLDHGAVGDGSTDDTAAIQAAINAALSNGVKRVFFPNRTYIVSGSGDILTASAGLELYGPGTIKVKNANGPWNAVFNTGTADASGLYIHGLTWDGNATNNQPVSGDIVSGNYPSGARRQAIRADYGSGITIENNTFHDWECEWVFISGHSATNVKVLRNRFLKIGNLTDSALVHDHSTVYVDAIGFEIAGNVFSAYEAGVVSGPVSYGAVSNMDTHGSHQNIHHNLTIGYIWAGQLSTSPYVANTGIYWHHNTSLGCGTGLSITPYSGQPMKDVLIANNTFEQDYLKFKGHPYRSATAGISMYATSGSDCTDVRIVDNTVRWIEASLTGQTQTGSGVMSHGIRWERGSSGDTSWDRNLTIARNTVVGAPNNGIAVKTSNVDGLDVSDNIVVNANSTADASTTYSVGIYVDSFTTVARARVDRNEVRDSQSATYSPYGNTAATVTAGYSLWFTLAYVAAQNLNNRLNVQTGWAPLLRESNKAIVDPAPMISGWDYVTEHVTRTTLTVVADTAYWVPIRLGHGAVSQVGVETVTADAASSIEAALYASDATGRPGRKLYSLGTIASNATGWHASTAGAYPVQAGVYWIGVAAHGGTPTLRVGTGRSTLIRSGQFGSVTTTDLTGVSATGQTTLPSIAPFPGAYGQAPVCYVVGA